ncbi:MAG: hypothetical protein JSS09_05840 [Verrucomicrobia bacterium]|nr:hypothetical protein [Verrucomicrobiota bacterium]
MKKEYLSIIFFCFLEKSKNKIFILIGFGCVFFLLTGYFDGNPSEEKRFFEVVEQIDELEKLKKQHQKNIRKHLNLAHRWQSHKDLMLESKREYALAENLEDKLKILEKKLVKLKQEKKELQEK